MTYLPLARKYRPQTFSDLVGQDDTARAIGNGIKMGREARAVIFSGVRGVGKTTTARLYAKALNCEKGPTADPCNMCESCESIGKGTHEDVMEIDGASHTGVEDVRVLKETVTYRPQRSQFKVYIIDEVHMLSQSAFNALLKTLEEPPPHVVFLFATTELQKVPQTILSRCQTFFLSKFTLKSIVDRLAHILDLEKISYDPKALALIGREAHGSMRDAITLLDQTIAFGNGEIDLESVSQFVSAFSTSAIVEFIQNLLNKDSSLLLSSIENMSVESAKYSTFVEELATWSRHLFIVKEVGLNGIDVELLGLDEQDLGALAKVADGADLLELNRLFRILLSCSRDLNDSEMDRFIFENVCLEWCLDPGFPSIDQLISKPSQLGPGATASRASESIPASAPPREKKPSLNLKEALNAGLKKKIEPQPVVESTSEPVAAEKYPFPESWRAVVQLWASKDPLRAKIIEDTYDLKFSESEILVAVTPNSLASSQLLNDVVQKDIARVFGDLFGFEGQFKAVPQEASRAASASVRESVEPQAEPATMMKETLREEKIREKEIAKQELEKRLRADPTTQFFMQELGTTIESVELS